MVIRCTNCGGTAEHTEIMALVAGVSDAVCCDESNWEWRGEHGEHGTQCFTCGEIRETVPCKVCGEPVCEDCRETHKWEDAGIVDYRAE